MSNINSERKKGFGSSDATEIRKFALTGELSNTLKRRIGEIKGDVERKKIFSQYFELGVNIEDLIFSKVKELYPNALSNPLGTLESHTFQNFTVTNHIDFLIEDLDVELKATKDPIDVAFKKYLDQVSLHNLIRPNNEIEFWVYDTSEDYKSPEDFVFDIDKLNRKQIHPKELKVTQDLLIDGFTRLDQIWHEIPTYEELEVVYMNEAEAMQVKQLQALHTALELEAKAKEEIKTIRESLLVGMEKKQIKSIKVEGLFSVTYKDGHTRSSIDSSKVKEKLGEEYKDYIKLSSVKPSIQIKLIS